MTGATSDFSIPSSTKAKKSIYAAMILTCRFDPLLLSFKIHSIDISLSCGSYVFVSAELNTLSSAIYYLARSLPGMAGEAKNM